MVVLRFNPGDKFLVWRVVGRRTDEILLEWEAGQLRVSSSDS
jgi:hypothetical protein